MSLTGRLSASAAPHRLCGWPRWSWSRLTCVRSSLGAAAGRPAGGRASGSARAAAGALTTLPVVCMGLFAPVAAVARPPVRRAGRCSPSRSRVIGGRRRRCGRSAAWPGSTAERSSPGSASRSPARCCRRWCAPATRTGSAPVTGLYTAALIGGRLPRRRRHRAAARRARTLAPQVALALWAIPAVVALAAWLLGAAPAPRLPYGAGGSRFPGAAARPGSARCSWAGSRCCSTPRWPGWPPATPASAARRAVRRTAAGRVQRDPARSPRSPCRRWRTAAATSRPWIAVSRRHHHARPGPGGVRARRVRGRARGSGRRCSGSAWAATWRWRCLVLTENAPTPQDAPAYTGMAFFVGLPAGRRRAGGGRGAARRHRQLHGVFATLTCSASSPSRWSRPSPPAMITVDRPVAATCGGAILPYR